MGIMGYVCIYMYRGWTIPRPGKIHEKRYLYRAFLGLYMGIIWDNTGLRVIWHMRRVLQSRPQARSNRG